MPLPLPLNPSYYAYTRGCEAAEEQSLELVYNLSHYFDELYPTDLLIFVLRELNPPVQLEIDEVTGRRDWPWLSEADLETLENNCRHYSGEPVPTHQRELQKLMVDALPNVETADQIWHQCLRLACASKS